MGPALNFAFALDLLHYHFPTLCMHNTHDNQYLDVEHLMQLATAQIMH